jgi:hypothetical protein
MRINLCVCTGEEGEKGQEEEFCGLMRINLLVSAQGKKEKKGKKRKDPTSDRSIESLFAELVRTRVGQNQIYTVYTRYSWQGNYQMYGHIQSI